MPQVQIVNHEEYKPDSTGVQEFFSNLSKTYKDSKDKDTFGNLLKEYSQMYLYLCCLYMFYLS